MCQNLNQNLNQNLCQNREHGCTSVYLAGVFPPAFYNIEPWEYSYAIPNQNKQTNKYPKNPTNLKILIFAKFNLLMKQLQTNFSFSHSKSIFCTSPSGTKVCLSTHPGNAGVVSLANMVWWARYQSWQILNSLHVSSSSAVMLDQPKAQAQFFQPSALCQTVSIWTHGHIQHLCRGSRINKLALPAGGRNIQTTLTHGFQRVLGLQVFTKWLLIPTKPRIHRIEESFGLEKTCKITKSNH